MINNNSKLMYTLVFLISFTALVYFLAIYHDVRELNDPDSSLQKRFAYIIEITLFLIVGFGYIGMAIWILIDRINTIIPYIITIVGSIFLIWLYLLAITRGVPIVGVEHEPDVLAIISKILQGSIISITAILISSIGSKKAIPKVINKINQNCVLCGRQIIDENASVTLRKPDGTNYVFHSNICKKNFQKLSAVYGGDNLT